MPDYAVLQGGGATWSDAEEELLKMSAMRCPGDMLRRIMRYTPRAVDVFFVFLFFRVSRIL